MPRYNKEALLADYYTGLYTVRELSDRHNVSKSTVSNITKGIEKKNADIVDKKVSIIQATKNLDGQELDAIDRAVQFKSALLGDIERFSNRAMQKANDLIANSDSGQDFNAVITGVDRLSILNKINDRHAPPANIQQNTQNNTVARVTFRRATKEDRND